MTRVKFPYDEFDPSDVRTFPLAARASKVQESDFARAWDPASGFDGWLASLPKMLAAADLPKLKLKWAFGLPESTSSYSQPAVAGGRRWSSRSAGARRGSVSPSWPART